jgi:hypothetical protein
MIKVSTNRLNETHITTRGNQQVFAGTSQRVSRYRSEYGYWIDDVAATFRSKTLKKRLVLRLRKCVSTLFFGKHLAKRGDGARKPF